MKKLFFAFLIILLTFGCDTKKSVHKDLITGLSTEGDGLSCEEVTILSGGKTIQRKSFIFGEEITFNFSNIEGFKEEDGKIFPGMSIVISDKNNDTIIKSDDAYQKYSEGISLMPVILKSDLTLARPIHSGNSYSLFINIWDKKDDGKFSAEMNFEVKPNEKIKATKHNCNYDELYLLSDRNKQVITDNVITFGDNIYLIFEGVKEFSETDNKIFPGLSLEIKDGKNEVVLFDEDLFKDYESSGIDANSFEDRVSANFWFNGSEANNPLKLTAKLWDKLSDKYVSAETFLTLK
ncbi:Hypothetical protein IALB_3124 [Ignavibacterium album JCM 16511]|uniref:Lipoprotein n=1 Tax=Ignavibacterium album (strain DSM 19864 / JCM 16511 / NBRC 101810 / Mat9-16) TaxID=945713 RepID=I0APC0_IGNAJ|nr:hypothetical protein [Ignavibacterium album]AFH50827.1 Hypothetical protein IALB_3124 [Ignavibacterium album JCM 16511]